MAETYLNLGESKPAAATLTPLYTVPAATSAVVSSVTVCNQAGSVDSFRISLAPAGAADAPSQYISFDVPIAGNDTIALTLGITMAATDVLRVRSTNGNLSFTASGVQIT